MYSRIAVVVSLASLASASAAEPDFSHELQGKANWYEISDAGTLLVATNKSVIGISPRSGEIAWERADLKRVPDTAVSLLAGTPAAFVLEAEFKLGKIPKGTLHMLDVTTGEDYWTIESGPVMYTQLNYEDGAIFVMSQEFDNKGASYTMRYLDLKSGDVRWSQDHYFGDKVGELSMWQANPEKKMSMKMTMLGNQPLQIVDGGAAYLELWHSKQGVTKRELSSGKVLWSRPGKFKGRVPTPMEGRPVMRVADSKIYVTNNAEQLWAYDLASGEPVWTEKKAPKQFGTVLSVLPSGENVLITGNDGKKSFVMVVNGGTGEEAWKKPLKLTGMMTHFEELEDERLVIGETSGTTTLVHVANLNDGKRALAKPIKLPGGLSWSSVEDNKIFATGSNGSKTYVGMWDLSTGASKWEGGKGYRLKGSVPNLVMHKDKVLFVDSGGYFTSLDRSDGKENFKNKLEFGGKESAKVLAWRDDLLVTFSDQNVFGLKPDSGETIYHAHYPPPPPTGLQVAAGAALIAASAASSAASMSESYKSGASAGSNYSASRQHGENADNAAAVSSAFGAAASDVLRRAKASKASENNYYILTKIKEGDTKGVGLKRVDLRTGEENGSIVIDTRNPVYEIDESNGLLYLIRNDKVVEGYRFE